MIWVLIISAQSVLCVMTFLWGWGNRLILRDHTHKLIAEAEALNHRWKLAVGVLVLKAVREAVQGRMEWTYSDEERLRKGLQSLVESGVPLETFGMSEADFIGPTTHPDPRTLN